MSVFDHAQGKKTVHAGRGGGWGSKNGKLLSTQLLNDPLVEISNVACIAWLDD